MIKRIAFVLALVGVGAIAVGCSKPSGETALQQEMSQLWTECKSQSNEFDLSCLEMRKLHRDNPDVVNPAAEREGQKLLRQSELMSEEFEPLLERLNKETAEIEKFNKETAEIEDQRKAKP